MQKIFNFFPLTVYKSTLSLSENEKNEMIEEVRLMEKKSKNLDYKSTTKAWTGDTQGFEYLHNNPKCFLAGHKVFPKFLKVCGIFQGYYC